MNDEMGEELRKKEDSREEKLMKLGMHPENPHKDSFRVRE